MIKCPDCDSKMNFVLFPKGKWGKHWGRGGERVYVKRNQEKVKRSEGIPDHSPVWGFINGDIQKINLKLFEVY